MNELIVVIVNQGFEEEVMQSARSAGARGGTIFNARGTANTQDEVQFLGITLHPDKEIILILSDKDSRIAIMNAIKLSTGLTTPGAGIIFSLPVDSVIGFNPQSLETAVTSSEINEQTVEQPAEKAENTSQNDQ